LFQDSLTQILTAYYKYSKVLLLLSKAICVNDGIQVPM